MPMAASAKIAAAVVTPMTLPRSRRMTPAPRKPMPWTMLEAMRVVLESPVSRANSAEMMVKRAAPRQTQTPVRIPAGRLRMLRSTPMTAPRKAAQRRRYATVGRGSIFLAPAAWPRPAVKWILHALQLELREFKEVACSGVYLFALEFAEAFGAEFFDGKAAHDGAVDHGPAQGGVVRTAAAGEIAHETSGERVARTGWIVRFFERKCRDGEHTTLVHHHGAVFAALDDERFRAELENVTGGEKEIVLVGELAGFRIIDHQDVNVF